MFDPNECCPEIYSKGKVVGIYDVPKALANSAAMAVSDVGPQVDWFFAGGRVVVKTLGCVASAKSAWDEVISKPHNGEPKT